MTVLSCEAGLRGNPRLAEPSCKLTYEKENTMFINIDSEKGITSSEKLTFENAMRLLGTATIAIMQGFDEDMKKQLKEEEFKELRGRVYDMYNIMAGNILDTYDPMRSPSTDLTAQAIMEAENAILDREVPDKKEETNESESDPA
jgi:hypothetical protein